jgi:hypothetical protein
MCPAMECCSRSHNFCSERGMHCFSSRYILLSWTLMPTGDTKPFGD